MKCAKIMTFGFLLGVVFNSIHGTLVQLDGTFGAAHNGTFLTNVESDAQAMGLLLQSDGKIVVVGNCMADETSYCAAARYAADGVLDQDFGSQGIFTASLEGGLVGNEGALQADGKIVIVGSEILANGQPCLAVTRLTTAGALDAGFGVAGVATLPKYGSSTSVGIAADQKIVIAGSSAQNGVPVLVLSRLNTDGSVDTDFGDSGYKMVSLGTRFQDGALAIDGDGNIVVTGYAIINDVQQIVVLRFTANGTPDANFGQDGLVKTSVPDILAAQAYALAIQTDGKIIVVGGADDGSVVLRYNATDGSLDETFGTAGIKKLTVGTSSALYAVHAQTNGNIVIGGSSDGHSFCARLTSIGSLDANFGVSGIVTMSLGAQDMVYGLQIQSDGKILAAGPVDETFAVTRLLSSNAAMISITSPADGATITGSTFLMNGFSSQTGSGVRLVLDGTNIATVTSSSTGAWDARTSPVIANGVHTLVATLLSGETILTSDTHTITINAATDTIAIAEPASDSTVATATPDIEGTSSQGSKKVRVKLDGTILATVDTEPDGSWELEYPEDYTSVISSGAHTLVADLMDGETVLATTSASITSSVVSTCSQIMMLGGTFLTSNPPVTVSGSGSSCPPVCDFLVKRLSASSFEVTLLPKFTYVPLFMASTEKSATDGASVSIKGTESTNKVIFITSGKPNQINFMATSCRG